MDRWKGLLGNEALAIRCCFVLMFFWGIAMSFLVPPWQTPDENAHLQMIGESIGNPDMYDEMMEDMELDAGRIRFQYEEKVDKRQWSYAAFQAPQYGWRECLPHGLSFSVLKHLPATIGIELGVLFRLPTFWVLELGELASLMFYLVACVRAIRLMPTKKEVLLLVMAFPMSMQQAASLNYDAVLLPLCFLYVAYIFHMRLVKECLGWADVAYTLGLLLLIVYIKIPYLLLGLLVFLLPKEKIHLPIGRLEIDGEAIRRWRIPASIALVALVAVAMYFLRENLWVRILIGTVLEWKRSIPLYLTSILKEGPFLIISSVGVFGWLDARLPATFAVLTYLLLLVLAAWGKEGQCAYAIRARTRVFLVFVFGVLVAFMFLSMTNHTITATVFGAEYTDMQIDYDVREMLYEIPYISGPQGRYFLPFAALPFLAAPEWGGHVRPGCKDWLITCYIVLAAGVSAFVLYARYWAG